MGFNQQVFAARKLVSGPLSLSNSTINASVVIDSNEVATEREEMKSKVESNSENKP